VRRPAKFLFGDSTAPIKAPKLNNRLAAYVAAAKKKKAFVITVFRDPRYLAVVDKTIKNEAYYL
jgi:hypothetical protein